MRRSDSYAYASNSDTGDTDAYASNSDTGHTDTGNTDTGDTDTGDTNAGDTNAGHTNASDTDAGNAYSNGFANSNTRARSDSSARYWRSWTRISQQAADAQEPEAKRDELELELTSMA